MAFVTDTFTDADATNLTAHTGETGATWAKHALFSANIIIHSNRAHGDGARGEYYASGTPATAEYDVQVDVYPVTTSGEGGIWARRDTSADTGYLARYSFPNVRWELYKGVAGAFTLLGSYSQSLSATTTYVLKLSVRNSGNLQEVFIDGVSRITASDSAISSAGAVGLHNDTTGSSSTGIHLDNLSASDAAAATAFNPYYYRHLAGTGG